VHACMARQWFRFAFSRLEQPDADDCSLRRITDAFEAAKHDIKSLPVAAVDTPAFLYRRPGPMEVKP
jgi:hypothetical protein